MFTRASKTVTGAAILVGLGFLGSRLLGALRAVAIANEHGTSAELDAFWVAIRLPDLVFQLLAGATLAAAFIPVYARYVAGRGEEEAWRLASVVLNWVLIATVALATLVFLAAEWIVPAMAPGLGEGLANREELRDQAIFLTRVMLVSPILFAVSGMITGILNARRHFLLPAFAPMLYNLSIIGGAVFLSAQYGIEGLAIGVIVGSGLHLIVQLPALINAGFRMVPSLNLREPGVQEVLRLMGPRMIGLAAAQVNLIVLMFFASFEGEAAISALNFAWLLLLFPVGLFGMSMAMAVFPTLAEKAAHGQHEAVREMVAGTFRFTIFLSVPASVAMIFLRDPLVRALLEHGLFDEVSSEMVSSTLLFFAIGLFAHSAIEVLSRGFYALGDTRTPVTFAVGAMVVNMILAALLVGPLDIRGLALALSIASILEMGLLILALHGRLEGGLITQSLVSSLVRTVIATVIMAEGLVVLLEILDQGGDFGPRSLFALVVGVTGGAIVYYLASLIMRMREAELIAMRVQSLFTR